MKRYSYLYAPNCLESFYREVLKQKPNGQEWKIYQCLRSDCVDSERFVAIRNYTKDRLKADNLQKIIADIWRFEY